MYNLYILGHCVLGHPVPLRPLCVGFLFFFFFFSFLLSISTRRGSEGVLVMGVGGQVVYICIVYSRGGWAEGGSLYLPPLAPFLVIFFSLAFFSFSFSFFFYFLFPCLSIKFASRTWSYLYIYRIYIYIYIYIF